MPGCIQYVPVGCFKKRSQYYKVCMYCMSMCQCTVSAFTSLHILPVNSYCKESGIFYMNHTTTTKLFENMMACLVWTVLIVILMEHIHYTLDGEIITLQMKKRIGALFLYYKTQWIYLSFMLVVYIQVCFMVYNTLYLRKEIMQI